MKILFTLFATLWVFHDYHVSIYELNFNSRSKRMEISMKLFVDDFEKALELEGKHVLFGDNLLEGETSALARDYIRNNFSISINGETVNLEFVGAEWEDAHAMFFYWQTPELKDLKSFKLNNTIFLEVSSEQENMHYFTRNKKEQQTLLLNSKNRSTEVSVD